MKVSRLNYFQYLLYLLIRQINYTLTHFADHAKDIRDDAINRYLREDHVTGSDVWHPIRDKVVLSPNSYVVFDAGAFLVWARLAQIARALGKMLYQVKYGLLDDYLCQQLKFHGCKMRLA